MMVDEENTPPKPPCGRESSLNGTLVHTLGSTPRGTPGRRRPNAPWGRPQPINLKMAWDPNVLANP